MDMQRIYRFIQRNWVGLGWVALMAFVLIHPRPGSPYFDLMFSLVSGFAFTAGLLLVANYRGLAERLRDRAIGGRECRRLKVGWADRSIVFARFMGVFFTIWGCIGFGGAALGYAQGWSGVLLVVLGGVGGVLIAVSVSRSG